MKLLRFIKNVWSATWDALFDGDLKSLLQSMCGYALVFGTFFATSYGLGWVGKLIGLSWIMPPDKRDDMFGLGVMIFGVVVLTLFVIAAVFLGIFLSWIKLKEIWKNS